MTGEPAATDSERDAWRQQVAALQRELADARAREAVLCESEARYRVLTEDALVGVYVIQDHKFAYLNGPGAQMFGARPEDLIGQDFTPFIAEDSLAAVEDNIRRRMNGEMERASYSLRIRHSSGDLRHLDVLGCVVMFGGRPAILGTAIDRTEELRANEALRDQTRLLQLILESMGDGVVVANARGELFIFNPAARRITGYGPTGTTPAEWATNYGVYAADATTPFTPNELPLARAMQGESVDGVELFLRNPHAPDGVWIRCSARPLIDDKGTKHGGVVVFHDTTLRRKMYEQLERAEARYRALVEQLPVICYTGAGEPIGSRFYVGPQVEPLLGYTPAEWTSDPGLWARVVHPEDRDRVVRDLEHCWTTGTKFACDYRMRSRNGDVVWLHDEAVVIRDPDGRPALIQGVLVDVTEREIERTGRKRMQALSMDLVAVQEAERRRIGLELHDDIGQVLTGLGILLGNAATLPAAETREKLAEALQLVEEATEQVRQMSQTLRPAVLDDLGLLPALASHLGRYERQTGIHVEFSHHGIDRRRFRPDLETAAYRIVQEALTNVARHAQVARARVRVWADDPKLRIRVEDEGVGFDTSTAAGTRAIRGIGGMRERAALLGGVLSVESAAGAGCRLSAELPILEVPDWR